MLNIIQRSKVKALADSFGYVASSNKNPDSFMCELTKYSHDGFMVWLHKNTIIDFDHSTDITRTVDLNDWQFSLLTKMYKQHLAKDKKFGLEWKWHVSQIQRVCVLSYFHKNCDFVIEMANSTDPKTECKMAAELEGNPELAYLFPIVEMLKDGILVE